MILHAANYCSHALDDLNMCIEALGVTPSDIDINYYVFLVGKIKDAQKFILPDYGKVFDIPKLEIKSFISKYCPDLRLPFPVVAIEYEHPQTIGGESSDTDFDAVIAIAEESVDDGEPVIDVFPLCRTMIKGRKYWVPVNFSANISARYGIRFRPVTRFGVEYVAKNGLASYRKAHKDVQNEIGAVMGLITALTCRNVEQRILPAPEALNKKRLKANKRPFFSYKVLTLKNENQQIMAPGSGSHASPRVHLRRGHIRRLEGRTVWINASVVGNKSLGMIQKDYRIAA